jgi:drug/metabolite transporter (DMT)-like permease
MAPLQFTQPLISLLFAVLLFAEAITPAIMVAAVTILAGIAITRRG